MKKTIEEVAEEYANNYFVMQDNHYSGLMQGFKAGAKYQSEQSEWIRVEDALPDAEKNVLILTIDNSIDTDWYNTVGQYWNCYDLSDSIITHWQPLPNPPQK